MAKLEYIAERDAIKDFMDEVHAQCWRYGYKTQAELGDALQSDMQLDWAALGLGFVIAAVVGFLAIKLVSWDLKKLTELFVLRKIICLGHYRFQ